MVSMLQPVALTSSARIIMCPGTILSNFLLNL